MESKKKIKVITLSHEVVQIDCDNCVACTNHNLTMQAVKDTNWRLHLVAVCWRCSTNVVIKFKEEIV